MLELRPYQQEAVEAVYNHLREKDTNPCVVIPCGCGKSLCLAKIAADAVTRWHGRVLILAHVKELLEQNADKVRRLCPELPLGIYSAGLKRRQTREPVIVHRIVAGDCPASMTCASLRESIPLDWREQERLLLGQD